MRQSVLQQIKTKSLVFLLLWSLLTAGIFLSAPVTDNPVSAASNGPSFVEFESGQVRPIAMSPDGSKLFAVNTPNGTLEIFNITANGLAFLSRVSVGMEPVAVAARNNNEVWVVNHLSDSVSVVSLTGTPHVVRTLLVGDEPRDIVFAGSSGRAFVTTAHRGQQRTDPSLANVSGAGDPQFTTAGVPRADVWIFDPANLGNTLGPCLAPDGSISPGGNPGPETDASGEHAPEVALIVKFNSSTGHWEDELHRVWDNAVRFTLPDFDVFAVDANGLTQAASYAHVGTTLFNMIVNPASGHLYVSNTESQNQNRFEGPGTFAGHTVQGHLAEARISVISGNTVTPIHLNKHIDYSKLAGSPGFDPTAKLHSLSMPLDMAVSSNGKTLYVAAFGSSKIGVFDTTSLENNTFDPTQTSAN